MSHHPSESQPSVSEVLVEAFGSTFENANLEQLLALMEAVPCLMLSMGDFLLGSAVAACVPTASMPEGLLVCNHRRLSLYEGLDLMGVLSTAIAAKASLLGNSELALRFSGFYSSSHGNSTN